MEPKVQPSSAQHRPDRPYFHAGWIRSIRFQLTVSIYSSLLSSHLHGDLPSDLFLPVSPHPNPVHICVLPHSATCPAHLIFLGFINRVFDQQHRYQSSSYNIFPHYLINGTIFGENSRNTKCVFWSSLQLLSETFLILRRTERDIIKNVHRSSCEVPVIFVRL